MEINPSINTLSEKTPLLSDLPTDKPVKRHNHFNGLLLTHYFKEFTEIKKSVEATTLELPGDFFLALKQSVIIMGSLMGCANAIGIPSSFFVQYSKIVDEAELNLYQAIAHKIIFNLTANSEGWNTENWKELVGNLSERSDHDPIGLSSIYSLNYVPHGDGNLGLNFPTEWTTYILLFSFILIIDQFTSLAIGPFAQALRDNPLLTKDQRRALENQVKLYAEFLNHDNFDFEISKRYLPRHLDWRLFKRLPRELQKEIACHAIREVVPTKSRIGFAYRECQNLLRNDKGYSVRRLLIRGVILAYIASQVMLIVKFPQIVQDVFDETHFFDHTAIRFMETEDCADNPCRLYAWLPATLENTDGSSASVSVYFGGKIPSVNFSEFNITSEPSAMARTHSYIGLGLSMVPAAVFGLITIAQRTTNWIKNVWKK